MGTSATVPTAPTPSSTGDPAPLPAKPSFVQIAASALTAVTSTLALSYLGVAGTLIGAGVAAVLTAFANYLYTRSLVRTRNAVSALAPLVIRTPGGTTVAAARPSDTATAAIPAVGSRAPGAQQPGTQEPDDVPDVVGPTFVSSAHEQVWTSEAAIATREIPAVPAEAAATALPAALSAGGGESVTAVLPGTEPADDASDDGAQHDLGTAPSPGTAPSAKPRRTPEELMAPARRRRNLRPYVITGAATFVVVIALVTIVELGLGKPLSDALRGRDGEGTSVSVVRQRAPRATPTRAPTTQEPAPTTTVTPTEQTPTQEPSAPTQEPTVDPTAPTEPTPEPAQPAQPTEPAPQEPVAPQTDAPATDAPAAQQGAAGEPSPTADPAGAQAVPAP